MSKPGNSKKKKIYSRKKTGFINATSKTNSHATLGTKENDARDVESIIFFYVSVAVELGYLLQQGWPKLLYAWAANKIFKEQQLKNKNNILLEGRKNIEYSVVDFLSLNLGTYI